MMRHQFRHHVAVLAALAASVIGSAALAAGDEYQALHGGQYAQQQAIQQQFQQQVIQQFRQQSAREQGGHVQVSDGGIAGVVSATNRFEIFQSTIARTQARTREVKDFAKDMIESHTRSERRLSALLKRLRIEVQPTRVSSMITGHTSVVGNFLRRQPAKKFDLAFMATQVMTHRHALRMLDEQLIPKAKNDALKQELQRVRGEVASHLARARTIMEALTKGQQQGR
ncbi:hypothetical protein SOCE26_067850 [Sorangium cellulosum]|uniref:DUF4142 domain-containing protein n=1 Tax=Sorangium cellulosum TaxID=56 RepID=A0A2L0F195_SORCE|nr:DUF4142 domain-containing protein [Sorangium cellulosum]AUX45303.1 hypothetical protein SOCE26_067850 [Sorangium cellulosum]